jgi:alkylation response protein AidB-like acyl-CoA dehydrogenase
VDAAAARTATPPAAARALAPLAAEAADEGERRRSLTPALAAALRESGLPRMLVPASCGGGEATPREMVEALEALAVADGSAAWCAMVTATAGYVAAYLEPETANELFGAGAVAAGVYAPLGTAEPGDGGMLTVDGRWPFSSFSEHADLLMGGVHTPDGARLAIFPGAAATYEDTWHVSGLRATGSNDMVLEGVEVPASHLASLAGGARAPGPLYAFPVFGLLALGIAAVALGIARAAIDDLSELATVKRPGGSSRSLAERAPIQAQVAQAEASVAAARAFVLDAVDLAWTTAEAEGEVGVDQRARLRMAATHATRSAAGAVDLMYEAGGGTSIYEASQLQRRFRDVHTATQHAMVAPATWELTGRLLLGLDTNTSQL